MAASRVGGRPTCSGWSGERPLMSTWTRSDFGQVIDLVADGIQTGRGRRGAYLHHDRVNG